MAEKIEILINGVNASQRAFSETFTSLDKLAIGVTGAAVAFAALIERTAKMQDQVGKAAEKLGISVQALSELKHAADLSDMSFEGLTDGIRFMERSISDAALGTGAAAASFNLLHVNAEKLRGLAPEDQMALLADALEGVKDQGQRVSIVMDIFGRAGANLLPMLKDGSAGLDKMRQDAIDLGVAFDKDAADKAEKFNDSITRLQASLTGLAVSITTGTIGDGLIGLIDLVTTSVTGWQNLAWWVVNLNLKLHELDKTITTLGGRVSFLWSKEQQGALENARNLLVEITQGLPSPKGKSGKSVRPDVSGSTRTSAKPEKGEEDQFGELGANWEQAWLDRAQITKDQQALEFKEMLAGQEASREMLEEQYALDLTIWEDAQMRQAEMRQEARDVDFELMDTDFMRKRKLEEEHYELVKNKFRSNSVLMQKEESAHQKRLKAIDDAEMKGRLQLTASFLGDLSTLASVMGKQQGDAWKALAKASAVVNAYLAFTGTLERASLFFLPPIPQIMAGVTLAAGLAAASQIGRAHAGLDFVPREGTFLLSRGERVVPPEQNRELTDFLRSGGGSGQQVQIQVAGDLGERAVDRLVEKLQRQHDMGYA